MVPLVLQVLTYMTRVLVGGHQATHGRAVFNWGTLVEVYVETGIHH